MSESLDVLAIAAHPDDVELNAGGTLCLLARKGYRTGIVDLTRGELGSRGTPEGREREAAAAAGILGVATRKNLGIPDGNIALSQENRAQAHNGAAALQAARSAYASDTLSAP